MSKFSLFHTREIQALFNIFKYIVLFGPYEKTV